MSCARVLLIDGDIFIYQHAAAAEKPVQWDEDLWTLQAHMADAVVGLDAELAGIKEALNADHMIVALSDSVNWRHKVLPTYKSNRSGKRPPMLRRELHNYVAESYDSFSRPTLEGDDVLGILATSNKIVEKRYPKAEKIIVSIDKDMLTIPALHFNVRKARAHLSTGEIETLAEGILEVSTYEADRYHLLQALTGDPTDGYSGCPSVGKVTAEKILAKAEADGVSTWEAVVTQYAKKKLSEEAALEQARVARICRHTDYNFKTKEVILWRPTK